MHEDKVDSIVETVKIEMSIVLIKIMEKLFDDLKDNVYNSAINCRNYDASTALYEIHGAIGMMNIPYLVREALEISHDAPSTS